MMRKKLSPTSRMENLIEQIINSTPKKMNTKGSSTTTTIVNPITGPQNIGPVKKVLPLGKEVSKNEVDPAILKKEREYLIKSLIEVIDQVYSSDIMMSNRVIDDSEIPEYAKLLEYFDLLSSISEKIISELDEDHKIKYLLLTELVRYIKGERNIYVLNTTSSTTSGPKTKSRYISTQGIGDDDDEEEEDKMEIEKEGEGLRDTDFVINMKKVLDIIGNISDEKIREYIRADVGIDGTRDYHICYICKDIKKAIRNEWVYDEAKKEHTTVKVTYNEDVVKCDLGCGRWRHESCSNFCPIHYCMACTLERPPKKTATLKQYRCNYCGLGYCYKHAGKYMSGYVRKCNTCLDVFPEEEGVIIPQRTLKTPEESYDENIYKTLGKTPDKSYVEHIKKWESRKEQENMQKSVEKRRKIYKYPDTDPDAYQEFAFITINVICFEIVKYIGSHTDFLALAYTCKRIKFYLLNTQGYSALNGAIFNFRNNRNCQIKAYNGITASFVQGISLHTTTLRKLQHTTYEHVRKLIVQDGSIIEKISFPNVHDLTLDTDSDLEDCGGIIMNPIEPLNGDRVPTRLHIIGEVGIVRIISDDTLKKIVGGVVTNLILGNTSTIDGSGLSHLVENGLNECFIYHCQNFRLSNLKPKYIKQLTLDTYDLSDKALDVLDKNHLESLRLANLIHGNLKVINTFPNLYNLELKNIGVHIEITPLEGLTRLTKVYIENVYLHLDFLKAFSKLENLKKLEIFKVSIDNDALYLSQNLPISLGMITIKQLGIIPMEKGRSNYDFSKLSQLEILKLQQLQIGSLNIPSNLKNIYINLCVLSEELGTPEVQKLKNILLPASDKLEVLGFDKIEQKDVHITGNETLDLRNFKNLKHVYLSNVICTELLTPTSLIKSQLYDVRGLEIEKCLKIEYSSELVWNDNRTGLHFAIGRYDDENRQILTLLIMRFRRYTPIYKPISLSNIEVDISKYNEIYRIFKPQKIEFMDEPHTLYYINTKEGLYKVRYVAQEHLDYKASMFICNNPFEKLGAQLKYMEQYITKIRNIIFTYCNNPYESILSLEKVYGYIDMSDLSKEFTDIETITFEKCEDIIVVDFPNCGIENLKIIVKKCKNLITSKTGERLTDGTYDRQFNKLYD